MLNVVPETEMLSPRGNENAVAATGDGEDKLDIDAVDSREEIDEGDREAVASALVAKEGEWNGDEEGRSVGGGSMLRSVETHVGCGESLVLSLASSSTVSALSSPSSPSRSEARRHGRRVLSTRRRNVPSTPPRLIFALMSILLAVAVLTQHPSGSFGRFMVAADDGDDDAAAGDDAAQAAEADDYFGEELSFQDVSVMPVSCLNYHNGQMIKFQFFENTKNYQCHTHNLGTFVVSVAHYMRAYFNYQALVNGQNFKLPGDVGYLNCVMLQETAYAERKLYAKIGCMERETFTSTKLQLHIYKDDRCTTPYDDGNSKRRHSTRGYDINGYLFSTKVSFRPPFYSCQTCDPKQISETFNKNAFWYDDDNWDLPEGYDDDYNDDGAGGGNGDDDAGDDAAAGDDDGGNGGDDDGGNGGGDDDDAAAADDDGNGGDDDDGGNDDDDGGNGGDDDDDGGEWANGNVAEPDDDDYYTLDDDDKTDDDDYYTLDDDDGGRALSVARDNVRGRAVRTVTAVPGQLEAWEKNFWKENGMIRRRMEEEAAAEEDQDENDDIYGIGDWNMCHQIHKHGMWCDDECRALDTFRVDEWSNSDIFLLVVMCIFMTAMMLLVFSKRVQAYEKASVYGDDVETPYPGLPPMAMVMVFVVIMAIILVLASLKFVNETLVFAVVTCILLFIYLLKLTLFDSKSPQVLPPRQRAVMKQNLFD